MAAHMAKAVARTARAGSGAILSIRWMSSEPLQDMIRSSHVKHEYDLSDCNALEQVTGCNASKGYLNNSSYFHAFPPIEEGTCQPFRGELFDAIKEKYDSMGRAVEPTISQSRRDQGSGWKWFGLDKKFRSVSVTITSSRDSLATIGRGRERYMHSDRGMLGTTVLCVRKGDKVLIIGDGQVTLGSEIIKPNVKKVRRIGDNVIGGFAGATADSFTLFERLESKLEEHPGQLTRAAVELAKAWRTDKYLRRLDAVMVVADSEISLTITGNGDVLEPHDGVVGIGSGGSYASAAARALIDLPDMDAETIARKAMKIAADCCIYTNHNWTVEQIAAKHEKSHRAEGQADGPSAVAEETSVKEEQVGT